MGRELTDLVKAAALGDQKATRELVEQTQSRLFRFCLVLCGDPVRAEDICQEGFVKALAGLKKLKSPEAFVDWLFRVTRNVYLDDLRKRRHETLDNEAGLNTEAGGPVVSETLAVHRVLSQFEPDDRLLLVLVDMENYSYRDAGEVLGITEDAVRSRLFRLRKLFVEKWHGSETK